MASSMNLERGWSVRVGHATQVFVTPALLLVPSRIEKHD
jgi:hypothetical protein